MGDRKRISYGELDMGKRECSQRASIFNAYRLRKILCHLEAYSEIIKGRKKYSRKWQETGSGEESRISVFQNLWFFNLCGGPTLMKITNKLFSKRNARPRSSYRYTPQPVKLIPIIYKQFRRLKKEGDEPTMVWIFMSPKSSILKSYGIRR